MAASSADLPHNLVGFVNDPVSEHLVLATIKEMGMAYAEAKQGDVQEVITFLRNNRTPKILIIDISNSELPLSDISKVKEYSTPGLNIIVVGSRNDVGLFRDLMSLGVSDYLVKPLNGALIRKAIEEANNTTKLFSEKTGKMVQFISSVGGAGATTASSNVAWILANRHFKRSVVMDLDFLFGTSHLMLDIKAENTYTDILESPEKIDEYFVETILKKHCQRLYYLGGLADILRGVSVDAAAFEAMVTTVKRQFNYVLVDTQRDMTSVIHKICMNHTNSYVVMVEMSLASAQNTARLIEFFNTDQTGKKIMIVANKVGLSSSGALSRDAFEKVIDRKIDYIMPIDEGMTLAAANIGQPLASSSTPLTEVLEDIADDLLGKNETLRIAEELIKKEGMTAERMKLIAIEWLGKIIKIARGMKLK